MTENPFTNQNSAVPPPPYKVENAPPVPPAPKKKKKKGKYLPLSSAQIITLCVAVILTLLFATAQFMYLCKVKDLEDKNQKAQAEYDRKVYRTTVKYKEDILKYAAQQGIHPAYMAAIILNESSYVVDAVSSANARGLMQLLPSTGEWIAPKIGVTDYTEDLLFDKDINMQMGAWYLGYLSRRFDGDPILVACAYHAGAGNVDSWIEKFSTDKKTLTYDQIPYDNSRSYARKVVNSYAIYLQHYYTNE